MMDKDAQSVTQELKACPFCGCEPWLIESGDRWCALCSNGDCFCAVGEGYDRDAMPDHAFCTEAEAIAAWNTRASQPTSVEDAWRPIDTAPRDGTWILVCEADYPELVHAHYAASMHSEGYWMANCGQHVTETPCPTHWMPLPAAPGTASSPTPDTQTAAIGAEAIERRIEAEYWRGIRVVGYYYEVPTGLSEPSSQTMPKVDFHWSTPGRNQETERLVKLSDVLALLALSQPVAAPQAEMAGGEDGLPLALRQARYVLRSLHNDTGEQAYLKLATACEMAADRLSTPPQPEGGAVHFVATDPIGSADEQDEDGNPLWYVEIQTIGGWSVVATVWGGSAEQAAERGKAVLAALTPEKTNDQ